jgi:Nif-specific regulatory protein
VLDRTALLRELAEKNVDLDEVLRQVIAQITEELEADRGTLFLVDHARGQLVSRIARLTAISEIRLRIGQGVAGQVALHGQTINVPSGTRHPKFEERIDAVTGYLTQSMLTVPVFREDTVIGVLQLLNKKSGRFTRWDEKQLERLAETVGELLVSAGGLGFQLRRDNPHSISFRFNHIVGSSRVMSALYERTNRAAATDATVLIRGESGTGKELFARAVHDNSRRSGGPFVKVDCAALPAQLIENELFGHVKGAFTGADSASEGKVQAADGGTLFLDEVGELPLDVQGKLLRLLQERTFLRVGAAAPQAVDVRFVCATHRELEADVAAGRFRQDLYYRLRVVELNTPPLRLRGHSDLDRLTDHFLYRFSKRHDRPRVRLSAAARSRIHAHSWPGNVRELEHCIESAVVLSPEDEIGPELLPISQASAPEVLAEEGPRFVSEVKPLRDLERDYIEFVLRRCEGNRSEAARQLGIGRNTLQRKLKE